MDSRLLPGRAFALALLASVWLPFAACSSGKSDLFTSHLGDAGDGGDDASGGVGTGGTTGGRGGAAAKGGSTMKDGTGGTTTGGAVGKAGATGSGGSSMAGSPGRGGSAGAKSAQGGTGGDGCDYAGKTYADGDSFPSSDGCNTCFCDAGSVGCTQRACAPEPTTCEELDAAIEAELQSIQACEKDEQCGQQLKGTSCGCTRDLVARLDADITRFETLRTTQIAGEECSSFVSTCDCPAADGFACENSRCTWNYQKDCQPVEPGRICVQGLPLDSGDRFAVGDELLVRVWPAGCFSSSCTETTVATCAIEADGHEFTVTADFCARDTSTQGAGCTADCGGVDTAQCQGAMTLEAGEYTMKYGGKSLTFEVPGVTLETCIQLEP